MTFAHATLAVDDAVATLTFNHPQVMNAFSPEMAGGVMAALDVVHRRQSDIRCVVLTGAGRAFCTGANLQGRKDDSGDVRPAGALLQTVFHPFIRRLRDLHCPLVTCVNGPAAGAGMSFALMGDLVIAARSAYFLQAFRRIGLVPDCGATWIIPRLIGRARALELSLLGEKLSAETALTWGLVNRVVDDAALVAETRKIAVNLASGPTLALAMTRRLYWDSAGNSFEEQLDLEERTQKAAGASLDYREGVAAFLEKRPARFTGE